MLITVTSRTGELRLAAYSNSEQELHAVDMAFLKAGLDVTYVATKRFLDKRPGRLYRIRTDEAYKLEELLRVRFHTGGRKVKIEVEDEGTGDAGYRCERVIRTGKGKDCVNIDAHNMDLAIVKCALLAHSRKWFGGVAQQGPCSGNARH